MEVLTLQTSTKHSKMNLIDKFILNYCQRNKSGSLVIRTSVFILLLPFLMISCNGSKAYFKRGAKLQEQGLIDEAATSYYGSLQRNRNNIDAKIGLKTTGQQVLNRKIDEFIRAKNLEQKKEGVYSFIRAKEYQEKIKRIGVTLEINEIYQSDYESLTQSYLSDLYDQGTTHLSEGNFRDAETCFKEIGKFDSNYKDAGNLADIAYLEPKYKKALENFEAGKFRSAFNDFDDVISRNANFKNAQELKQSSLDAGLITLAVLPFKNATSIHGLDKKVSAYSLDALTKIGDPFLKVVDRENFSQIIDEQQLGMSGIVDDETAVNAGNLIGAKTILTGTVLNYEIIEGKLQKTTLQGYESYQTKKLNQETEKYYYETKYRTATYYKYQKKNAVRVSFQYKVTSSETGEVLASKIIEDELEDAVVYAEYSGDGTKLFPKSTSGVNTSRKAKKELDRILNGRKNIRNTTDLTNNLMKNVSNQLSGSVGALIRNQVK